jgi:two-component system sensor histidine kinase CpxA
MIQGTKELTANVSHELRSPLARIRVAQELIKDQIERGNIQSTQKHLEGIQDEIELLDTLIGRILALSRMDFQESPYKWVSLNPEELLSELIQRFSRALAERGIRVEKEVASTPSLWGDPDALKTAVSNLLENALKYTPMAGQVSLRLFHAGESVVFSVTNTHAPIPEAELSRIFEPFHRLKTGPAGGTGLGLAITRRIVERQGGTIEALNVEEGLCIKMVLPVRPPHAHLNEN